MRTGLRGEYLNQYLRSYSEYIFAVYLDKVLEVTFETELFRLRSGITGEYKIPDFFHVCPKTNRSIITEIKSSQKDNISVIIEYATNRYDIPDNSSMSFVSLDRNTKRSMTSKISDSKKGRFTGVDNSNYGNTYTDVAKKKISEKWSDPVKKRNMKIKGMLTHISRFSNDEFSLFTYHCNDILNGKPQVRPKFLNRAYTINKLKIRELFGCKEFFNIELRKMR